MKLSKTTVTNSVEFVIGFVSNHDPITRKIATPASGTVVKAGSPIDADGAVANDATAIGILLSDVDTASNPNGTIIQAGSIDSTKAQEYCGITYASEMMAALDIHFITGVGVNS